MVYLFFFGDPHQKQFLHPPFSPPDSVIPLFRQIGILWIAFWLMRTLEPGKKQKTGERPLGGSSQLVPSLKLTAIAPENGWLDYEDVSFWGV